MTKIRRRREDAAHRMASTYATATACATLHGQVESLLYVLRSHGIDDVGVKLAANELDKACKELLAKSNEYRDAALGVRKETT